MSSTAKRSLSKSDMTEDVKVKKGKAVEATNEATEKTTVSVAEFYDLEDSLAASQGTADLCKQLLDSSSVLKEQLKLVMEGKEITEEPSSLLLKIASLKRSSRFAYYANAALKRELCSRVESVEAKYMQLQNSSSEIQHLQREIERCLEFTSADENIDLIDVDEFYSCAPESVSRPSVTRDNEHEQRVCRLNFELIQRKQLVSTLSEQEGRRNVLISDINGKETRLKSLKPKIEALIKTAKPVQEVLGVRSTASVTSAEQRSFFALLPPELSVLYVQAEAYRDIIEDAAMTVGVAGDVEEASRLAAIPSETAEEESEEEGAAESGEAAPLSERRRSHRGTVSERLEGKRAALIKPHPIFLHVEIGCIDDVKVRMKIQYLPELRVSTLKWKVMGKLPSAGGMCAEETLFDDLFPGDNGELCPNAVGAAKLTQLKVNLSSLVPKLGRPFKFVQRLTGSGDNDSSAEGTRLADELQAVIRSVRSRVIARASLAKQFKAIDTSKIEDAMSREGIPPLAGVTATLKSCKIMSEEQYLAAVSEGVRELSRAESGDASPLSYLSLVFEHPAKKSRLAASVCIYSDHPRTAPLWTLSLSFSSRTFTADNSIFVKSLESWMSVDSVGESPPDTLLLRQVVALLRRVDLLSTLDLMSEEGERKATKHLHRISRGRDGEMPFEYIEAANTFSFK